jgi:hypothetical protein
MGTLFGKNVVKDSCLHIEIPGRMHMLLGFGAEYYFEAWLFAGLYLVCFLRVRLQYQNLAKLE